MSNYYYLFSATLLESAYRYVLEWTSGSLTIKYEDRFTRLVTYFDGVMQNQKFTQQEFKENFYWDLMNICTMTVSYFIS